MTPLRVTCPNRIVEGFKVAAITAFPKEKYGVFLGRRRGLDVLIRDIWIPDGQNEKTTADFTPDILIYPPWREEAQAIADSEGLDVVGDIHSHPYRVRDFQVRSFDRAPSEDDWSRVEPGWIHAICVVNRAGKRVAASVKFWPEVRAVEVAYV